MATKDGKRIYIGKCSDPKSFHKTIYNALGLVYYPIGEKRVKM